MTAENQAPEGAPGAPAKAKTPLIIDVLARWEDQNGSLACVLASEWDALRQEVMDAAVIESPRMARNRLEALAAQPHKAALAARSATAIACLPDAPYKVALQKLHDDMLAALAAQPQAAPASHAEFALRALVAAGHITQAKADEAMQIAERVMPQTKEPTNDR